MAESASSKLAPLRVAVLRSYTIEPLEPVLKLRLILEGFRPTIWMGGYNQYVQEVVDPGSELHQFQPDLVLLMVRLEEVMPDFVDDFPSRTPSEWGDRITSSVRDIGALVAQMETSLAAQVIVQNMVLPRGGYFGVNDSQRPFGQSHLVHRFNEELSAELAERSSVFIWDFDRFVSGHGYDHLFDPKMWYVSRNPYRQSAYPSIADDLMRHVGSALGRIRKCIVLDLDNTLWGGVAGEDGIEGIRLGHSYPGNCYRDFQKELLKLSHRGILLAINSKNNEEDALRIIDDHPDMILRREHFAAMKINWRDKAANLRELAQELGIGIESFIVIDDNPAECDLIRRECPETDVILLPDKPYLLPDVPRRLQGVENIRLTPEDRGKGAMYRVRAERREHQERYSNLDDFLRSLEMEVGIEAAVPFTIPRIAQLTQKTNQMNMTTRRYTEAQIQAFVDDPARAVFSVSSRDRFGDDGIIGVIILMFDEGECRIDTFLLSCRVIGRGIEQLMLAFIADLCRDRGVRTLIGEFIATPRNKPAAGFFERMGFEKAAETLFLADLQSASVSSPSYIRLGSTPVCGLTVR
jgi:FkbH-like protein